MLTSKQKSELRSLANTLPALFQVGKDGVSANLTKTIGDSLTAHELVKVSILKSCPTPSMEVALDISSACKCEIVQIIGRTVILYRKSKENKIKLP
jgi:RNA-binding protein